MRVRYYILLITLRNWVTFVNHARDKIAFFGSNSLIWL